jgi:ribosomal protein S27AE
LIKPEVGSSIERTDNQITRCPHCGSVAEHAAFDTDTSLQLYGITLKNIHKKRVALCAKCHGTFEIEG